MKRESQLLLEGMLSFEGVLLNAVSLPQPEPGVIGVHFIMPLDGCVTVGQYQLSLIR
jgi:hypothetical protein